MTEDSLNIGVSWGCICDPISQQLQEMGIKIKSEPVFDRVKKSLNFLSITGFFTNSQISTLYKRANDNLTKEIKEAIKEMSNEQYENMLTKVGRN